MKYIFNLYQKTEWLHKLYNYSFFGKYILRPIVNIPPFIKWKTYAIGQWLECLPRALGSKDSTYIPLKQLKDKYKGKRVFVTCTGPSLTISDLEQLKDEYVFGMNSIALIHEKSTMKPDFFGIQDSNVWDKIGDTILNTDNGLVFVPASFDNLYSIPKEWVRFPLSYAYHMFELCRTHQYFAKYSDDCYRTVYDGYSITYSILQIATYLGFDEIYLIGADCTYMGEKKNFIEHGNIDPTVSSATDRLYASYGEAKRYAESHGIKIFNATRGGCLELFERVKFEEVISNCCKNKIAD
jgi:hypothetical protein